MGNQVRVLFFAGIKEKAKTNEITLDFSEPLSILQLKFVLADELPAISEDLVHCVVALNREYASDETILTGAVEVAFFPPVSGGVDPTIPPTLCKIQMDEIDINEVIQKIITPTAGAVGMFTGVVRSITRRNILPETEYLIYEAYTPMAEEKMSQIAEEIRQKWSQIEGVAIVQRVGRIDRSSIAVLIACAAPHRGSGVFDAAHYGIDRLKEIVPVWKEETGPDGKVWIEGSYRPKPAE